MNSFEEQAISLAGEALKNAYAPYSHFRVGAALVTSANCLYSGCNVENASYGLTICAERAAAVKAVSDGVRQFVLLAVTAEREEFIFPCGACLQFLSEFCADLKIISVNSRHDRQTANLRQLLPRDFRL